MKDVILFSVSMVKTPSEILAKIVQHGDLTMDVMSQKAELEIERVALFCFFSVMVKPRR